MSASISSTRAPPIARASARLHAVVVLPSSGCALVTITQRVGSGPLLKISDVRSERKASPNSWGTLCESSSCSAASDLRRQSQERNLQLVGDIIGSS